MKDILVAVKESLAIIAVIFACAVSIFCVMRLGEWVTLLIAGCAYILYIGLSVTIKRIDKEENNVQ